MGEGDTGDGRKQACQLKQVVELMIALFQVANPILILWPSN